MYSHVCFVAKHGTIGPRRDLLSARADMDEQGVLLQKSPARVLA